MKMPVFRNRRAAGEGLPDPGLPRPAAPPPPDTATPPERDTDTVLDERLVRWQVYVESMLIGFMSNPAMTVNVAAMTESIAQAADHMVEQEAERRERYHT